MNLTPIGLLMYEGYFYFVPLVILFAMGFILPVIIKEYRENPTSTKKRKLRDIVEVLVFLIILFCIFYKERIAMTFELLSKINGDH